MINKKLFSYILVSIILGFLLLNLSKNWQTIVSFNWRFDSINFIVVILFLIPVYFINATSWHLLTKALGFKLTYMKSLKIWLYSNIGRFIPGVVWQYFGRVYLTNKEGIPKSKILAALGLEAMFNLTAGTLVIFVAVCFWGLPIANNIIYIVMIFLLVLVFIILSLSNGKIVNYLVNIISRLTKKNQDIAKVSLPFKSVPIILFPYILQFIIAGSILFFLTKIVIELSWGMYPIVIGIFAAAWLLGYISFFSPSGLGIQELSLAGFLSLYMPFSIAAIIAVVFRLLLIVSELSTVFILSLLNWFIQKNRSIN